MQGSARFNRASERFEAGCGGYGYNRNYIGGSYQKYAYGDGSSARSTAKTSEIANPAATVLLADCAVSQGESLSLIHISEPTRPY